MNRKVFGAIIAVVVVVALLLGCAAPAPAPSPSPAPSPAPSPTASPKPTASPTAAPSPTASPAPAVKPMLLKGVLYKLPATAEAKMGRAFMAEIEKRSNGILKFQLVGGDEVVPSLEQHEAVRKGVVDWSWTPGSYGAGIFIESNAHTLLRMNNKSVREKGIYTYLNDLYEKQGFHFVTNIDPSTWENNFLFILTKPIQKPEDMKGMKMRSIPSYQPVIEAFGAVPIGMAQSEEYTALERGLIVGGPNTVTTTFDFALQEQIKYYVLPGFGHSQIIFQFNLAAWKKIPPEYQKMIDDTLISLEPEYEKQFIDGYNGGIARLDAAGVKGITLSPEDGERLVTAYYDANWKAIIAKAPVTGAKLRELAGLKPLK